MRRMVLLVLVLAGVLPASAQAWTWPVDGKVLRPFVLGDDPYAGGQHRGIDVAGELGAEVRAPATGTVSFAGTVPKGGKTLSIRTPDGYTVTLQHLGTFAVRKGAAVNEGDLVATVGTTGEPDWSEPYVYLGIRVTAEEQGYVDPQTLLPARLAPDPVPPQLPAPTPAPPVPIHPHSHAPAPTPAPTPPPTPAAEPISQPADPAATVPQEPSQAAAPPAPASLPIGSTEVGDGPGFAPAAPARGSAARPESSPPVAPVARTTGQSAARPEASSRPKVGTPRSQTTVVRVHVEPKRHSSPTFMSADAPRD